MNNKSNHLLLLLGDEVELEEATFSSMISNSTEYLDHYKLKKFLVVIVRKAFFIYQHKIQKSKRQFNND